MPPPRGMDEIGTPGCWTAAFGASSSWADCLDPQHGWVIMRPLKRPACPTAATIRTPAPAARAFSPNASNVCCYISALVCDPSSDAGEPVLALLPWNGGLAARVRMRCRSAALFPVFTAAQASNQAFKLSKLLKVVRGATPGWVIAPQAQALFITSTPPRRTSALSFSRQLHLGLP